MSLAFSGMSLVAALIGSTVEPYSAAHPEVYAGTYAVRICHSSCTGPLAFPFLAGTIVLFKSPLGNGRGRRFRVWLDGHPANACFVLKPTHTLSAEDGYFPAHGFFSWAMQGNTAYFELVRSDDGGYAVYLNLAPKGLAGKGVNWGGPPLALTNHSQPAPQDSVVADRIGEPDLSLCPRLRIDRKRAAEAQ